METSNKGARILSFLEADRGTMPVERAKHNASSIARRVHAYALSLKAGIHRSRFGGSRVRILTVTTSESRCETIRNAVSGGRGIFLQNRGTPGFSRDTCLGPLWRSITDDLVSLLD